MEARQQDMKVAVIDVGYNSLKMVKYRTEPDGSVRAFGQLGVMAKLGEGLDRTGYLEKASISRTMRALKLCQESAAFDSIKHVLLIGTSPIRETINREAFLQQVRDETGLEMKVLTGNEEALYGLLGATRSVGAPTALFFDLGGGSLELVYMENFRVKRILSLPLGALKLTSQHAGKDGAFSRRARARMRKRISQILPSKRELEIDEDAALVGTGGTVRAMARFEQDETRYALNKVHNYSLAYDSVQNITREFLRLRCDELAKVEAIGEDRARTVAAGAVVVQLLMKKFEFKRLVVSTHGLRDGILADFLGRGLGRPGAVIQTEEVEGQIPGHSNLGHSGSNSELLECLLRNGVFDNRQEKLLVVALGKSLTPECSEADPNALFGILMSEDLPMSHEDQLLMTLSLVRARRPRTSNWLASRYGLLLSQDDLKSVRRMGACLKLMEILERSSARCRVTCSRGIRINILDAEGTFPMELAEMAAEGFSLSIRKPVIIVQRPKAREHQVTQMKASS